MSSLRPDIVLLGILLVLPGFVSQIIFNAMVARSRKLELSNVYQSILHSIIIYVFVYTAYVLFAGDKALNQDSLSQIITSSRYAPLITVVVLGATSILWGYVFAKTYKCDMLVKFIKKFGEAAEPPNLYAALLDSDYGRNKEYAYVVIPSKIPGDNGFCDGYVLGYADMVKVEKEPREIYLTKVSYLDHERNEVLKLPEHIGVILNVDTRDITEIALVNESEIIEHQESQA